MIEDKDNDNHKLWDEDKDNHNIGNQNGPDLEEEHNLKEEDKGDEHVLKEKV